MDMNGFQSPEDLLADESFLAWYYKTDATAFRRWEDLFSQDSSHKALAESAVEFLQRFDLEESPVPVAQIDAAEERLFGRISASASPAETPAKVVRMRNWRVWVSTAACVLVVLLAAYLDKNWISGKKTLSTPYGQIARIVLPDSTVVMLNAHSILTYSKTWKEGSDREVWLKGEAFLHVSKKPLHDRFIVHAEHFDVIVTGTAFDVLSLPAKGQVALKEGSVTLQDDQGQELKMVPGDVVDVDGSRLVKQTVNPDDFTAWTDNKMDFDNTPISELIKMIQLHYGVKVEVSDPGLLNHTLNGIFPNDNLDVLLRSLEATKEYRIKKDGDRVVIQPAY